MERGQQMDLFPPSSRMFSAAALNLANSKEPLQVQTMKYFTHVLCDDDNKFEHHVYLIDANDTSRAALCAQVTSQKHLLRELDPQKRNSGHCWLLHCDSQRRWSYSTHQCIRQGDIQYKLSSVYYIPQDEDKKTYATNMAYPISQSLCEAARLDGICSVSIKYITTTDLSNEEQGDTGSGISVLFSVMGDKGFSRLLGGMRQLGLDGFFYQLPSSRQKLLLLCISHWHHRLTTTKLPKLPHNNPSIDEWCQRLANAPGVNATDFYAKCPPFLRCPVSERPMRYPVVCSDHNTYDLDSLSRYNKMCRNREPIFALAFNRTLYQLTITWLMNQEKKQTSAMTAEQRQRAPKRARVSGNDPDDPLRKAFESLHRRFPTSYKPPSKRPTRPRCITTCTSTLSTAQPTMAAAEETAATTATATTTATTTMARVFDPDPDGCPPFSTAFSTTTTT